MIHRVEPIIVVLISILIFKQDTTKKAISPFIYKLNRAEREKVHAVLYISNLARCNISE
jgi:hypothetical protein